MRDATGLYYPCKVESQSASECQMSVDCTNGTNYGTNSAHSYSSHVLAVVLESAMASSTAPRAGHGPRPVELAADFAMCVRAVVAVAHYVAALLRFEAGGVGGLGRDTATIAFVAIIATATATAVTATVSVVLLACIHTESFPGVRSIVVGTHQHAAIVTATTTTAQRCPSSSNQRRWPCSRHSLPFRPLGPNSRIQRQLVKRTVVETKRGVLLPLQDVPFEELFL